MVGSTLQESLQALGLSDTEIAVYRATLERDGTTVSALAEAADVSSRHVYNLLETLEQRGFVRVDEDETPTVVRPTPSEELFETLTERVHAACTSISMHVRNREDVDPEWPSLTPPDARSKLRRLVREGERDVFLSLPASELESVAPALREVIDDGRLVLLMLTGEEEAIRRAAGTGFADVATVVRTSPGRMPILLNVDERVAALISHLTFTNDLELKGVIFSDDGTEFIHANFFMDNVWPAGDQVFTREPDPLPRSFESARHAVVSAELHRKQGRQLHANVFLDSDPDDAPSIDGPVVDVRQRLVVPRTNTGPTENVLVVEGDDGETSVGPGTEVDGAAVARVELSEVAR